MYGDTTFGGASPDSPSRAVRALTDSLRRRGPQTNQIYRSISQVGKIIQNPSSYGIKTIQ